MERVGKSVQFHTFYAENLAYMIFFTISKSLGYLECDYTLRDSTVYEIIRVLISKLGVSQRSFFPHSASFDVKWEGLDRGCIDQDLSRFYTYKLKWTLTGRGCPK